MYRDKINRLETHIEEIKKVIKADKKEIKKRENIIAIEHDEDLETEILEFKEEIENLREQLKMKKQVLKKYKKL